MLRLFIIPAIGNKKDKENPQNDGMNPAEPDKLVSEGPFYFTAWPNPQVRRGEGKLFARASS